MLLSLAVDYRTADVATRERFHVPPSHIGPLYLRLKSAGIAGKALISTCNRTELYAWCPAATRDDGFDHFARLAHCWMPVASEAQALLAVAVPRTELTAARHALRVAAGLESQVLGDGQILGQFRNAYSEASAANATGPVLHRLFETALRAGKRVQSNTLLGSGRNSVGAQAAALSLRRLGSLAHKHVVVVGCGKTGERAARQLAKFGAKDMVFINRSPARATSLAEALSGRTAAMQDVYAEIAKADLAIIATGAPTSIISACGLAFARENSATNQQPLLLVDLSMPRNVDPASTEIPGVTLVDLDALSPHISAAEETRRSAIPAAEAIVERELQDFDEWLSVATAREAIRPLREALADVCRRELAHAAGDEAAERLSKRIVAKMMARPMSAVRVAMARGEPVTELTRAMSALFSIPHHEADRAPAHADSNAD